MITITRKLELITITRKLEFDAGHRVLGHEGKCRHLHGHRYVAEVEVQANRLNPLGMVIDFGVIKTLVGGWIDDHWDHNLILHFQDPFWGIRNVTPDMFRDVTGSRTPYRMESNPTAENMARELYKVAHDVLHRLGIEIVSVTIHETPNCKAVYKGDISAELATN